MRSAEWSLVVYILASRLPLVRTQVRIHDDGKLARRHLGLLPCALVVERFVVLGGLGIGWDCW